MATYPELAGKGVIVTGAGTRGSIGEAIAQAFAQQGSHVAVVDIDVEGTEHVAARICASGGRAFAVGCDVTDALMVREMIDIVIQRAPNIHVLVNNAGGFSEVQSILQITPERWDAMLALNLKSVFLCSQAVYEHMAARRSGRIINVSSVQGRMPSRLNPAYYSAAKAGVIAFTKVLAQELAEHNVTANVIAPGATMTQRFERLRGDDGVEALRKRVPLKRISEPSEQADAALFLASDAASYITGATIDVNGGSVML